MLAKLRKPAIVLASLLLLYAVIGFFIIPAVIQAKGPKMITEQTGRPSSVSKVTFNPFTLSLTLEGFEVDETDGQKILAFDRLLIDLTLRSLLKRAVDFEKVHLTAPYVWVDIFADGRLNLLELLPAKTDEKEPEDEDQKPFPVWIEDLKIENGHVRFDDLSHKTPFEANITPINLHFENLTTLAVEGGADTFTTELKAGGRLSWTGTLSLNPLLAKGHLQLVDASMPKLWEYLEDRLHFQLARGTLSLGADLLFDASGKTLEVRVSNGRVALDQFLLTEKGAEDALVEIPQVVVDGIELDLAKQRLAVTSVESKEARMKVWRDAGGAINYQTLFALESSKAAPNGDKTTGSGNSEAAASVADDRQPEAAAESPWVVQIDKIALSDYALDFEDRSTKKPFAIRLDPLDLTVDHFTTERGAQIGIELTTKIAERGQKKAADGSLDLKGSFSLTPLASQGHLQVARLDLRQFLGYLPENIPLEIKRGMLNVMADYQFDGSGSPFDVRVSKGQVGLEHLEFGEKGAQAPLITIPSLALDGIGVELAKQQLTVASVSSKDAVLKGWRDADGMINYQKLFGTAAGKSGGTKSKGNAKPVQAPSPTPKTSEAAPTHTADKTQRKNPPWTVRVDRLALKNYALHFEDRSAKKPVTIELAPLNLDARQISNKPGAKLRIGLESKVNGNGRIKLSGDAVLDPLSTDLSVAVGRIGLKVFQPYLEPFARIHLISGTFDAEGKVRFTAGGSGHPSLHYAGTAGIADFHSKDTISKKDFIKWEAFQAKGIDFDLRPMRLEIAELLADWPYARVVIRKDHSTNIGEIFSSSSGHTDKKGSHSRPERHSKKSSKRGSSGNSMFPLAIKSVRITNV